MAKQTLSQVLLRDLEAPCAILPILGKAPMPEVLVEHMTQERRAVGTQLQKMESLMACIAICFEEYTEGKRSKDALIADVSRTVTAMAHKMFYDETATLAAE